jgi:hypothetical protein
MQSKVSSSDHLPPLLIQFQRSPVLSPTGSMLTTLVPLPSVALHLHFYNTLTQYQLYQHLIVLNIWLRHKICIHYYES